MKEDMIFKRDQINVSIRSLKKRRPDIYQLLLPELVNFSLEENLPIKFPVKYFGEIFQKFLNSFSEKLSLKNYNGQKESVYLHFAFGYDSENKTFSVFGSEMQDVVFELETGIHTVHLGFFNYPLEKANGAMIRLIIALQKHMELSK